MSQTLSFERALGWRDGRLNSALGKTTALDVYSTQTLRWQALFDGELNQRVAWRARVIVSILLTTLPPVGSIMRTSQSPERAVMRTAWPPKSPGALVARKPGN